MYLFMGVEESQVTLTDAPWSDFLAAVVHWMILTFGTEKQGMFVKYCFQQLLFI